MKLLGWMHRKFRPNNGDAFKDFASGGGGSSNCLPGRASLEVDDEEHYRHRRRLSDPFVSRCLRLSSEDLLDVACAGDSEAVDKIFGGLLAIGTLGVDSCPMDEEHLEEEKEEIDMDRDEAVTPRFGPIAERAAAAAENDLFEASAGVEKVLAAEATTEEDLVVVSVELEKVLAAEAEKVTGSDRISSARPSAGDRISCPLQGFLFGSPIEMAETMGKREKRVSLGELFMRSKISEEEEEKEDGVDAGEGIGGGRGGEWKSTAKMLKKMLKRRGFGGSGGGNGNNWTAESKFQKILKIFHRKVHPENTATTKKSTEYRKHENENDRPHRGGNGPSGGRDELMTFSKLGYQCEYMPSFKCCLDPTSLALGRSDSSGNREHWIKTDADYLVLEL